MNMNRMNRLTRNTRLALVLMLALGAGAARSQLLKDPQWAAWAEAGQTEELDRAALARLRSQPEDPQAIVAHALSVLADANTQRSDTAARAVQGCLNRLPEQAACHYAMAMVQGVEVMNGGALKALGLAGPIRKHLIRALELDPLLFDARLALLRVYLKLPSIAGGSKAKARELAHAAQARQPEHAKLLNALLAAEAKQWPEMERTLRSIKPGSDPGLHSALRDAWYELAMHWIFEQQYGQARSLFENLARSYPTQAVGPFGLARLAAAQGQFDESARQFERARALTGAKKIPLDYRLGLMLLDKGDKVQARAALERFVAGRKGSPKNLEDARKRLAELN